MLGGTEPVVAVSAVVAFDGRFTRAGLISRIRNVFSRDLLGLFRVSTHPVSAHGEVNFLGLLEDLPHTP